MTSERNIMDAIADKNIIVFDGECVLCSGFFKFVVKHDRSQQFQFVIAQSDFGEALYAHYGLKAEDCDTNLVIIEGRLYERLHGFFEVMKILDFPWKIITTFSVLPNSLLDWAYYKIARNRYRLFGRRDTCLVPDQSLKARFVDG